MKIVILDPVYFEKNHMEQLKTIGEVIIYDTFANNDDQIVERLKDANIMVMASTNISRNVLANCRFLKHISLACTGYNRVDMAAAYDLGITVTNVPNYSTSAAAEQTFALLLALLKKLKSTDEHVRGGNYDWREFRLSQLEGKTFGIIGFGAIGTRVAYLANAFGCKVITYSIPSLSKEMEEFNKVKLVTLENLLTDSDIISLHVPINSDTEGILGYEEFSKMKKKPFLINTARGKLINHEALIDALAIGKVSGAGLDVLPYEPPQKEDSLLKFSNTVFSPHVAFHTTESLRKCADIVIENIDGFIKGYPVNVVKNCN